MISILNGVDCQRFHPTADRRQARKACGLPEDALVIGAVGRFIATKRYPLLLEAFQNLAQDFPHLHLMILGASGPERENVPQLVQQSSLASRIHLMGHQAEPAPFYQAMDLLAMPSSHEGLANALLEAMAIGVPALAHAACGGAEVIEDGISGFLTQIDSASDLAQQISRLVQAPSLLQQVARNARQAAQERFLSIRWFETTSLRSGRWQELLTLDPHRRHPYKLAVGLFAAEVVVAGFAFFGLEKEEKRLKNELNATRKAVAKLDNLISTVDWNGRQIDGDVDDVLPLGDLPAKWKAFGWEVLEAEGNDMQALLEAMVEAKARTGLGKPVMVLMRTEMGQGVDFMMNSHAWHGIAPNDAQLAGALAQLPETLGDY